MIPQNVIDYENARWWESLHLLYFLVCALPVVALAGGIAYLIQRQHKKEDGE